MFTYTMFRSRESRGSVVVVVYSQFLYRYKQTQSAKTQVPASRSLTESSQRLSQQVNKCSEVKYRVFKVEVKVRKEQTAECTGVQRGQRGLLNWRCRIWIHDLDSREKAMYNQCGGGFTTMPSQPPRGSVNPCADSDRLINTSTAEGCGYIISF